MVCHGNGCSCPSHLNQDFLCNPGTTATDAEVRKIETHRELLDNGYIFIWCPWKYRILEARAVQCSSRVPVKCSSFVRWTTSWEIFEATDFNDSSDRQCGLFSRNCERQRCVRRNLLHIVFSGMEPVSRKPVCRIQFIKWGGGTE